MMRTHLTLDETRHHFRLMPPQEHALLAGRANLASLLSPVRSLRAVFSALASDQRWVWPASST